MIDRYTKIALTVIAASLAALVLQNFVQIARAQNTVCGGAPSVACWVQSAPKNPLWIAVNPKEPLSVTNPIFQPILVQIKPN